MYVFNLTSLPLNNIAFHVMCKGLTRIYFHFFFTIHFVTSVMHFTSPHVIIPKEHFFPVLFTHSYVKENRKSKKNLEYLLTYLTFLQLFILVLYIKMST